MRPCYTCWNAIIQKKRCPICGKCNTRNIYLKSKKLSKTIFHFFFALQCAIKKWKWKKLPALRYIFQ